MIAAQNMTHVTVRNGLTLAYTVGLINAGLALVEAFGIHLTQPQDLAITGFVNAAILLAARVFHMPERTADGGTVAVTHVPELVVTPPNSMQPTPPPTPVVPVVPVDPPPVVEPAPAATA